jgi:RNA polymerase sigma factor (sigma-70 family)
MHEDDAELVRQSLSDQAEADQAFARLVARYRPAIYGLAFAATGDAAEAEDLTQETLITAYLGLPHLRDPALFGAWLKGIARNLVRMWYRRHAATPRLDGGHALDELVSRATLSPEEHIDRQERLERIRQAVQELSTGNQQAVTLRYWAGMSYAEISETLDVPVSTVKSRLHKAKRQLQAQFGEQKVERRVKMIPVKLGEILAHEGEYGPGAVINLVSEDGRSLPIWIGLFEGQSLALSRVLSSDELIRPLTFDMVVNILTELGAQVSQVVISALKDTTFYATIHLALGQNRHRIDARPSDAINLAIRTGAPLYVANEVMEAVNTEPPCRTLDDLQPLELPEAVSQLRKCRNT